MSAEIDTLHVPFIAFLKTAGIPYINPRGDRESTIAEGHPDFTLLLHGHCLMIEFKDKEGRISAAQKLRIEELEKAGNKPLVLRDLHRAIEVVIAWRSMIGVHLPAPDMGNPITGNPVIPQPTQILVRFGSAVMQRETNGSLTRVRAAGPDDLLIPELSAA